MGDERLDEVGAIGTMWAALQPFDLETRNRMLRYLQSRANDPNEQPRNASEARGPGSGASDV
jgi:hypothetical protein